MVGGSFVFQETQTWKLHPTWNASEENIEHDTVGVEITREVTRRGFCAQIRKHM